MLSRPDMTENAPEPLEKAHDRESLLVSVVIPAFNRDDLLKRAMESVIHQTHRNLEIVVVDDGSEGSIRDLVTSFNDERIVYLRHETNRGVSSARNTGANAANGKILCFLDSDDEYYPPKVSRQVAHLLSLGPGPRVSYCMAEAIDDVQGKSLGSSTFFEEGNLLPYALRRCVLTLNKMMLWKADYLRTGGFDETMRMHEDWDFLIRLARDYQFFPLREVLVRVHRHEAGQLTKANKQVSGLMRIILDRHQDLYKADRQAHSIFLSELGYQEALEGKRGQALHTLLKSIALSPTRLDAYMKFAMVWMKRARRAPEP
jgi:glycosyltransferase involved in cell wall biosynthesis